MISGVGPSGHKSSFCSELHPKDLERLRNVLRRMFKVRTKRHEISEYELDRWIESVGPKVRKKPSSKRLIASL